MLYEKYVYKKNTEMSIKVGRQRFADLNLQVSLSRSACTQVGIAECRPEFQGLVVYFGLY